MPEGAGPVLIIDALNVFMRHFIANPTMSSLGYHVGGSVGFLKNLKLLVDKTNPADVIVVWEGGGAVRRRSIYPEYKFQRRPQRLNRFYGEGIPDTTGNRTDQVSLTVKLLRHVPVVQIYAADCEADDVIGYLIRHKFSDRQCVIVSSDKDYYQLLSEQVTQWSPGQKKFITPSSVHDKFDISVTNFCTARALIGDSSDNIPGIKGAGFKTLAKRFPELKNDEFVSVDDIINSSYQAALTSKLKIYERINIGSDLIRRNWKLMYLGTMNLAGLQIQKIDGAIDTFQPSCSKISLIRALLKEGLEMFDVDSFYMSINSVMRR